jgi:hypothetical protein
VRAEQREARVVHELGRLGERVLLAVARGAARAEAAVVRVVVAGRARLVEAEEAPLAGLQHVGVGTLVAGAAREVVVRSLELELEPGVDVRVTTVEPGGDEGALADQREAGAVVLEVAALAALDALVRGQRSVEAVAAGDLLVDRRVTRRAARGHRSRRLDVARGAPGHAGQALVGRVRRAQRAGRCGLEVEQHDGHDQADRDQAQQQRRTQEPPPRCRLHARRHSKRPPKRNATPTCSAASSTISKATQRCT